MQVQECRLYFVEPCNKENSRATQDNNENKESFQLKQVLKYSMKDQKLHDRSKKSTLQRSKSQDSSGKDQKRSKDYIGYKLIT